MDISLIAALDRNRAIGHAGTMPWHLPEDLRRFKALTLGRPVLMGRKTALAIGRALPGRTNLVLTRQRDWRQPGAVVVGDIDEALAHCVALQPAPPELWVIGGAQVYALAMPRARRAVVTEIDADFEGDTTMPSLAPPWYETARETCTTSGGLNIAFVTYLRPEGGPSIP